MKGCGCPLVWVIFFSFFVYECCQAAENACGSSKLPCDNSQCISRNEWCNGIVQCSDGSDERFCNRSYFAPIPDNHCSNKHFICKDGRCIPAVARCDGSEDCYDWTDEDDCHSTTTVASLESQAGEFGNDNERHSVEGTDRRYNNITPRPLSPATEISVSDTTRSTPPAAVISQTTVRTDVLRSRVHTSSVGESNFYANREAEESIDRHRQIEYGPQSQNEHQYRNGYQSRNEHQYRNGHPYRNEHQYRNGHPYRNEHQDRNGHPYRNEHQDRNGHPYRNEHQDRNGHQSRNEHQDRNGQQSRNEHQDRNGEQSQNERQDRNGQYSGRNRHDPHNSQHQNRRVNEQNENSRTNSPNQGSQFPFRNNAGYDTSPGQNFPGGPQPAYGPGPSTGTHQPRDTPRFSPGTSLSNSHRSEYDLPRATRNSYEQRVHRIRIQPRLVLHPPNPRSLHYHDSKSSYSTLPPFHFAKNYTHQYTYYYSDSIERAKQWLIFGRDSSYTWDDDTPRALVALSLITNSFTSDVPENDLMRKSLQTRLGIELLRNKKKMPATRLATYINALMATCQNPRSFLGFDLVEDLFNRRYNFSLSEPTAPLVFLTLCISNKPLLLEDIQYLEGVLHMSYSDEVARDRSILATSALACILQQNYNHDYGIRSELHRIRDEVNNAVQLLLHHEKADGSFGSLYTTAIAAQALMSVDSTSWDPTLTLRYLDQQQTDNGSFGDMLATYLILPVLSGRSLIHLRNTKCDQTAAVNRISSPRDIWERTGPRKNVLYSVAIGYPDTVSFAMQLSVPEDTSLLDTMRIAEYFDSHFRFRYTVTKYGATHVYAINGQPNDPERKFYWNLYVLEPSDREVDLNRKHPGDIQNINPRDGQEFLFWYLQND